MNQPNTLKKLILLGLLSLASLSPVWAANVNLSWTDNSNRETGFKIERATNSNGPWSQIGTSNANVKSFTDTNAANGTTYYYRVRSYGSGWDSSYSNIANKSITTGGSGTGLTGKYYNGTNLNTLLKTQTDPTVNFNWGNGAPAIGSINADSFSVSWTGQVQALEAGSYTFTTTTDDGARLWLNDLSGTPLVDKWIAQGPTPWSATYTLSAGQKVNLRFDYFESGGGASAQLAWKRPGQTALEVIPQSQLYPTTGSVLLTDRTTSPGGGTITARGDFPSGGETKDKAFDDSVDSKWLDQSNTSWIQYAFANGGYAISQYTLTSANDDFGRDPKNWVLKGSNSSTQNWATATVLNSQSNIDWATGERKVKKTFSFTNTTVYKYYRLEITATEGASGSVQLSEIELLSP